MTIDHKLIAPDGLIDMDAWTERWRARLGVGLCRRRLGPTVICPGTLEIEGSRPWTTDHRGVRWLTGTCSSCAQEITAPGGRLTRRVALAS